MPELWATLWEFRFLRFVLVGISGVYVTMGTLWAIVEIFSLVHLLAAAIALELSTLTNFVINDRWTFSAEEPTSRWIVRAAQYNAVALTGMGISVTVFAALTLGLGIQYLVANLLAMACSAVSNYLLNCRITWGRRLRVLRQSPSTCREG